MLFSIRSILFTNTALRALVVGTGLFSGLACASVQPSETAANLKSTAEHSKFEELQVEFQSGPEVTKACLSCHTEASKQLHKTKHWLWKFTHPQSKQELGKRKIINSFCGSITTNYARCTSCHIGYGWKDDSFDFSVEENVDCLVCHDTTDTYKKFPTGAGHPPYVDKPFPAKSKKIWKAPDLSYVAQNVGKTVAPAISTAAVATG